MCGSARTASEASAADSGGLRMRGACARESNARDVTDADGAGRVGRG